jgi:LuxR family maltose regulon positive regulatory protein
MDDSDNDPVLFWSAIAKSLDAIQAGLAIRTLFLLQSDPSPPEIDIISFLTNDLEEALGKLTPQRPVVLVVDDFQNIDNPMIHSALSAFIKSMPAQVRMVLLSRSTFPLQLGHLRLQDRLVEIGMNDLAFQLSEVESFLKGSIDPELPDGVAEQLIQLTEGWIGAIQLAVLYVQVGHSYQDMIASIKGGRSDLYNSLFDEVFPRQPEPVKQFLLITSVLDRLCAELCDRLIEQGQRRKYDSLSSKEQRHAPESQALMNYLVDRNLFLIPLDSEKIWFRYHTAFAQHLRHRLQTQTPKLKPRLHKIAAQWLAERGFFPDAIDQALASLDYPYAADLIEQGGREALHQGKYHTLRTWLQALPQGLIRTNPALCLFAAIINILYGQLNQAQEDLTALGHALRTREKVPLQWESLYVIMDILRAYLLAALSHDIPSALKLLGQIHRNIPRDQFQLLSVSKITGMEIYQRGDRPLRAERAALEVASLNQKAGNYRFYFHGIAEAAKAQVTMGKLRSAQLTLEQDLQQVRSSGADGFYDEATSVVVTRLAYEVNDLEKAWEVNSRRLASRRETGTPMQRAQALFALCELHLSRGDCIQAHQALDQVDAVFDSLFHPLSISLAAWRAHVWLKQVILGDNPDYAMAAAVNWADTISKQNVPGEKYVLHETIWPTHITLSRVRLAEGNLDEALASIETLRKHLENAHAKGMLIQVFALHSLIQEAAGKHPEALRTLLQALTWGEPEGFVRSIIDAGPPIYKLLAAVRSELKLPLRLNRYISKLLEICRNSGLPQKSYLIHPPSIHLTTTELKILQKLSEGYSTADIAKELTVSENTIKTHISHILNKLHVTRRAQAVRKALELTLLD